MKNIETFRSSGTEAIITESLPSHSQAYHNLSLQKKIRTKLVQPTASCELRESVSYPFFPLKSEVLPVLCYLKLHPYVKENLIIPTTVYNI